MDQRIMDLENEYMKQRKRLDALEDRILAMEQGLILPRTDESKPEESDVGRDKASTGASTE